LICNFNIIGVDTLGRVSYALNRPSYAELLMLSFQIKLDTDSIQRLHSMYNLMVLSRATALGALRFASGACLILMATLFFSPGTALAEPLSITGPEGERIFSQQDILDIQNEGDELITATPWTDGNQTFRGAPLAAVIEQAGIARGLVSARALNDYSINLPIEQLLEADAFLAVQMNGELMRIRDKGPFWIVFPWNDRPELLSRDVHAWSVWQLRSLTLLD
jgi:hypothetical protein